MLHSPNALWVPPSAGIAVATTWNNADKSSANLALSNSNRTVTYTPGSGNTGEGIRSVAANTANQKVYIEHAIGAVGSNFNISFAVAAVSLTALTGGSAFWVPTSTGHFRDLSSVDDDTNTIPTFGAGDRVGIAVNFGSGKAWFRKNGAAWNSVIGGSQDPAAGTGGLTITLTGGPFYAMVNMDALPGDVFTTNFASTSWVDTAPSGYTQLSA